MIAVAAPIAVTLRPVIASSANQTTRVQAGAEQRVGEGEHARVAGREAAAAVEPEPAEPQQPGAEQDVDGVVGEQRLAPVVLAGADHERRRQRREAGGHLDRDAAGEVEGAAARTASRRRTPSGRGPSRPAPTTAPRRRGTAENRIRSTTAPEISAVVMMQKVAWKAKKTRCGIVGPVARREGDVVEERVVEAADQIAGAVEGERVADRGPGDHRDRDRRDAHHERVEGVLRAHQPGVEEAEGGGHHQHQRGRGSIQAVSPVSTSRRPARVRALICPPG